MFCLDEKFRTPPTTYLPLSLLCATFLVGLVWARRQTADKTEQALCLSSPLSKEIMIMHFEKCTKPS